MSGPNKDQIDDDQSRLIVLRANVRRAMGERSVEEVAMVAGLDPLEVRELLEQTTASDVYVLARLEAALGVELWPKYRSAARGAPGLRPRPNGSVLEG